MEHTRRDLLGSGTLAAVGLAGCLDFAAGDGPQGPEGTPETLTCEDDSFVRLDPPIDGPIEGTVVETPSTTVELSSEGSAETYGQSIRVVLRNTGDAATTTLGEHAYAIQRETESGWLEVRGSTTGESAELPQSEEAFKTTGAYSWEIRLDEAAIASAVPDLVVDVCPPLGPGTHRFVYWGIVDAPPLGVEFDLIG